MLHPERWQGDTYTDGALAVRLSTGGVSQAVLSTGVREEVQGWAEASGVSRVAVVRHLKGKLSGDAIRVLEDHAQDQGATGLLVPVARSRVPDSDWLERLGYRRIYLGNVAWYARKLHGRGANEALYNSRADVPPQLGSLTVPQANYWSRVYDAILARDGDKAKAARIAWYQTRRRLAKHGRVPRRASGAVERMATDASEWDSWLGEGSRYATPPTVGEQIPESPAAGGVTEAALALYARHLRRSPDLPKPLGNGGSRVVYPLGNLVLKVERNPRDPNAEPDMDEDGSELTPSYSNAVSYSNSDEIRVWVEAPPKIRKHLVPLVAWASDGAWVVMDRVTPGGTASFAVLRLFAKCGIQDLYDANIAEDGRILDYGMLSLKAWAACSDTDTVEPLPTAGWDWSVEGDELFPDRPGRAVEGQGITTYTQMDDPREVRVGVGPANQVAELMRHLVSQSSPKVTAWAKKLGLTRLGYIDIVDVPRGEGDAAMREIERLVRSHGAEGIVLHLAQVRYAEALERFYARHGFEVIFRPPSEKVVMAKALTGAASGHDKPLPTALPLTFPAARTSDLGPFLFELPVTKRTAGRWLAKSGGYTDDLARAQVSGSRKRIAPLYAVDHGYVMLAAMSSTAGQPIPPPEDEPEDAAEIAALLRDEERHLARLRGEPLPIAAHHSVASITTAWARDRQKINDNQMPIMLPIEDVARVREYVWSRERARNSPAEWDALVESMRSGWDPKRPAHLLVGKDGRAKLGEGNHRLAIGLAAGLREVPVWVHFYQTVDGGKLVVRPSGATEALTFVAGVPVPDAVARASAALSPAGMAGRAIRGDSEDVFKSTVPGYATAADQRDVAYTRATAWLQDATGRAAEPPPDPDDDIADGHHPVVVEALGHAELAWLDLDTVESLVPVAALNGVSDVARSPRGFVAAYREADGDPVALGADRHSGQAWRARRNAFVARHRAQGVTEGFWSEGAPTRRHLALAMWAYSPTPDRLRVWLAGQSKS